jgi:GAF domain-containing protein
MDFKGMTTLPQDVEADLRRRILELEQRLDLTVAERDEAIERQTATALVNFRLQNELRASGDRQGASAEILRTVANTSGDAEHALQRIADTTARFFNAAGVSIRIAEGDKWIQTVRVGASAHLTGSQPAAQLATPGANLPATVYHENRQIHIPDLDNIDPSMANWPAKAARAAGIRTMSGTPLRRGEQAIGALIVYRDRLGAFTAEELALQQSFADQAVIAIENARLFNQTQEALERQTATADILSAISNSVADAQPVFEKILQSVDRLFDANERVIFQLGEDGLLHVAAVHGPNAERIRAIHPVPLAGTGSEIAIRERRIVTYADVLDGPDAPPGLRETARRYGQNYSFIAAPLLWKDRAIGAIAAGRTSMQPFTENECDLLRTFADQAVIAIENARLFNETREALERQTATADILKVIASSPSDVQPVFDAIVASAARLFEPCAATITMVKDGELHWNATAALLPGYDVEGTKTIYPIPFDPNLSPSARAILERRVIEIPDTEAPDTPELTRRAATAGGFRAITYVPLIEHDHGFGAIVFAHPQPGFKFSEKQLAMVQTFADQAVIAIQNAHLFEEVQQRTRDLSESLQQQTATADVLKVIASSPTDVAPVLQAIAESARELCDATDASVLLRDGDFLCFRAHAGPIPIELDKWPINRNWISGRAVIDKTTLQVEDLLAVEDEFPDGADLARRMGHRTLLSVPMLRDDQAIGTIVLRRTDVRAFSDKQIALLQTFAAQAVIAIENTRLFNETKEALERQTATADILKVIASSPSNTQPVFDAIANSAQRLLGGLSSTVFLFIDGMAHLGALTSTTPEADEFLRSTFPRPAADFGPIEMTQRGEVVQVPDTEDLTDQIKYVARARGYRSMVFAPLMNKGAAIGFIAVTRVQPSSFTDHHVQLLKTFADQAVIAIENAKLFEQVQARTRDLEEALRYQTGSAGILNVIASSPTDVKPVLEAIVESACELCGAYDALVRVKEGDGLTFGAHHGPLPVSLASLPITENSTAGAALIGRKPIHVHDLLSTDGDRFPRAQELARMCGERTILSVPLLREGEGVGAIVLRRSEVHPFSDKQIALLQTFADQAVIAIQNVRLFDEVQARTRDLTESLQQQTATAEVLKVISRSTFDLKTVLQTLVESAARLCDADTSQITRQQDGVFFRAEAYGFSEEFIEYTRTIPVTPDRGSGIGRALLEGKAANIPDVLADPEYTFTDARRISDYRAVLAVPMLREGAPIGVIIMTRKQPRPFTEKQIELATTFADQAAIAIGNVQLFDEVQARTRELAQSLEDLRAAQGRLIQTEKLASLGQLTAGIAHEIKNPLNFVNNFAALSAELTDELKNLLKPAVLDENLRLEVDELTGTLKDNLGKVVQHGKRADSIVKNMLLHSREGSGEHRQTDVNALVDESLNLAYHGARAEKPHFNVTLERDFDPAAGSADVFPQEITRVLLNLISNGFYAVTKRKAENGVADFEPTLRATTLSRGDHVEIRIRDNGIGIPEHVREKMFNPFFTTKPAGEGTGLGLSMSHDIVVKQHGGSIEVETEPGAFTEFRIVLPRASIISGKAGGTG